MIGVQSKLPIITCFDVEPDMRLTQIGHREVWKGFEQMHAFLSRIRPHLNQFTKAPVHYGWYFRLDPQIADTYGVPEWPLRYYARFVDEIVRAGDEIGVHPHTYRWSNERKNWVTIHDDPAYCNNCIEMSFLAYENYFSRPCSSFRMGDKWTSSEAIDCAEKLGAKYDLTLEPGHTSRAHVVRGEYASGRLPSFAGVPQHPYLPWRLDFRIPDKNRTDGLWMIPLSSDKIEGFVGAMHRLNRKLRGKWHEQDYLTLNFEMKPWIFRHMVDQQIKKMDHPYLAIVSRVSIVANPQTYDNMCANFKYLLTFPDAYRIRFTTPAEAMEMLGLKKAEPVLTRQAAS